jgi:protein-S-isoprenylcysteine O-methyltransferase Ste14
MEMSLSFPNGARLFIIVFVIWAASEVVNTFGIRHSRPTKSKDQGSYWIVLLVIWGSILVSLLAHALNLGVFRGNLQYLGLGLVASGIALREWAVVSLGRLFTVKVTVDSDQTLVRDGPYRWVRHPAYSGSMLTLVGFPLALGTWVGVVPALILSFAGYLYRVRIEEKAMLEVLANEYREYMQHTWRFFPGI